MDGEFEAGGRRFRLRRMPLFDQWQLYRRLLPSLGAIQGVDAALLLRQRLDGAQMAQMLLPLTTVSDDDFSAVTEIVLRWTEEPASEGWGPTDKTSLGAPGLIALVSAVAAIVLGPSLSYAPTKFTPTPPSLDYPAVTMDSGLDWLLRPWIRGKCSWTELKGLDLIDVFMMADALDVADENEARAMRAAEKKAGKR